MISVIYRPRFCPFVHFVIVNPIYFLFLWSDFVNIIPVIVLYCIYAFWVVITRRIKLRSTDTTAGKFRLRPLTWWAFRWQWCCCCFCYRWFMLRWWAFRWQWWREWCWWQFWDDCVEVCNACGEHYRDWNNNIAIKGNYVQLCRPSWSSRTSSRGPNRSFEDDDLINIFKGWLPIQHKDLFRQNCVTSVILEFRFVLHIWLL